MKALLVVLAILISVVLLNNIVIGTRQWNAYSSKEPYFINDSFKFSSIENNYLLIFQIIFYILLPVIIIFMILLFQFLMNKKKSSRPSGRWVFQKAYHLAMNHKIVTLTILIRISRFRGSYGRSTAEFTVVRFTSAAPDAAPGATKSFRRRTRSRD